MNAETGTRGQLYASATSAPVDPHDRWNYQARGETPAQRLDRCYAELLQEVRVAQTGVQLLLACLLTLAFTPRFPELTGFQRHVYVVSLVLGAAAAALLIAPAAFHRLLFARRLKHRVVTAAGRLLLCGLFLLLLSLGAAMLLILDVVVGGRLAMGLTAGTVVWFVLWWFAVPMCGRGLGGRRFTAVTPPRSHRMR